MTDVRENKQVPLEDFLKPQGRFKHLFKPENEALLEEIKQDVDSYWEYLQNMQAATNN